MIPKSTGETGAGGGGEGGAWLTDGVRFKMGCQEDRCEAEEGSQAGGVPAAAFAVSVEDVDLGRLEVEAGVDLNHRTGPGAEEEVAGGWGTLVPLGWGVGGGRGRRGTADGNGLCKPLGEGRQGPQMLKFGQKSDGWMEGRHLAPGGSPSPCPSGCPRLRAY